MPSHPTVVFAPDRRPAVRVRQRLLRAREQGAEFDHAWRAALSGATAGLTPHEATGWREALSATRDGWRCAYGREPGSEPVWRLGGLVD